MHSTGPQHRLLLAIAVDHLVSAGMLKIDEPNVPFEKRYEYGCLRTTIDGSIPALVCLSRPYKDEWTITIALWPSADAESRMGVTRPLAPPGEVYAGGWVNRWQFHGRNFGVELFHDARASLNRDRRERIAAIAVPADGEAAQLMRYIT